MLAPVEPAQCGFRFREGEMVDAAVVKRMVGADDGVEGVGSERESVLTSWGEEPVNCQIDLRKCGQKLLASVVGATVFHRGTNPDGIPIESSVTLPIIGRR